jgi:hypothetical protein
MGPSRRRSSRRDPAQREPLARLVGLRCDLDDLLADIGGGWWFRTRQRLAGAISARAWAGSNAAPELTPTKCYSQLSSRKPGELRGSMVDHRSRLNRDVVANLPHRSKKTPQSWPF